MKVFRLLTMAFLAWSWTVVSVYSDTVIVDETFDAYASTSAMQANWTPDAGDGSSTIGQAGELVPNTDTATYPFGTNNPPGIMGNGVANFGAINKYTGSPYALLPSATENVVVRGDIYVFDDGAVFDDPESLFDGEPLHNSRQTIGIRNDTADRDPAFGFQGGLNFIEMGTWNDSTCDPTVSGCNTASSLTREEREANPGFRDLTQFGYRAVIFGGYGDFIENGVNRGPIVSGAPNWQYFQLDPGLDSPSTTLPNGTSGNGDGVANITDIGPGWHRFQATMMAESILLELDLFRDGLNNVDNSSGVDASVEIEVSYATAPEIPGQQEAGDAPFDSLRIGGPSGVSSLTEDETMNLPGVFDNIYLALEDVSAGLAGDFDLDEDVDGADFLTWQRNGLSASELVEWQTNYGMGVSAPASGITAIPEPTTLALVAVSCVGILAGRRRNS